MAVKFVRKGSGSASGSGGGTYDHNLLINRGLPDQHTIEAITGLRTVLDRKYEKPFSGIPRTDLGFNVATQGDLDVLRRTHIGDINTRLESIVAEIVQARGAEETLKDYIDTKVSFADWSGGSGGGSGGQVESQIGYPLYHELRPAEGQTRVVLPKPYRVGTRQLEVLWNGVWMVLGDDYTEVDEYTVDFIDPLESDDLVIFQVRAVINSGLHEEYLAIEGQKTFTLISPYGINENILQVFRNGVLQRKGRDYREIDQYKVEFVRSCKADDMITFHQAGASDPMSGTTVETDLARIKANFGYNLMTLQSIAQIPGSDFVDTYVDVFTTDEKIDKAKSDAYLFQDGKILVADAAYRYDDKMSFDQGDYTAIDGKTYAGVLRLANEPGGAGLHSFEPRVENSFDTFLVRESIRVLTPRRVTCDIQLIDDGEEYKLVFTAGSHRHVVDQTSHTMRDLSVAASPTGDIRVCLTLHHGVGQSEIWYYSLSDTGICTWVDILPSENHQCRTPDITVDHEGVSHVVYTSRRISSTYENIEYVKIPPGGPTAAVRNLTAYTTASASKPRIVVGTDHKIRVVYETTMLDNATKNLRFLTLAEGIIEFARYLTQSTSDDNFDADMDIDSENRCHVIWASRRLDPFTGLDYCVVTSDNTISGVQGAVTGVNCFEPRLRVDRDDTSHIVFHTYDVRPDVANIGYTFITAAYSVAEMVDIASNVGQEFAKAQLDIYGDDMAVTCLSDDRSFVITKSLVNFVTTGVYRVTIDSKSPGTQWHSMTMNADKEPGVTEVTVEYRIGEDRLQWSNWTSYQDLPTEGATGRYMEIRAVLETTDESKTPEISRIEVAASPTFVEIQSQPIAADKQVETLIPIARFSGDVQFSVSRDGGTTFIEAPLNLPVRMNGYPAGDQVVIRVKIQQGAALDAWGVLW